MKKAKFLLLATMLPSLAQAVHYEVNGMGRVRSQTRNNYDFNESSDDKQSFTSYRFELGLKLQKEENSKTHIFLQPRFNKTAGDTQSGTTITSGSLNSENSFDAHQAYISHKFNNNLTLIAGRQELVYGDQLLVGAVGWHNIGRAFDGFKLKYSSKFGQTDLFSMTVKEESPYTTTDRDYDFNGLYHTAKTKYVDTLDLYYLKKQDLSGDTTNSKLIVDAMGLRAKSKVKSFDYRLEYTLEKVYKFDTGSSDYKTKNASQYDLEVGYKINKLRLAAGISMASEHFDQLYPTGHKWLGYADLFKRQNLSQKIIKASYKYSDSTKINLDYHIFEIAKTSSTSDAYRWQAPSVINDEKDLGSEIDLVVNHELSKDLSVLLKQSYFKAGEHYKKAGLDKTAKITYLQLMTRF